MEKYFSIEEMKSVLDDLDYLFSEYKGKSNDLITRLNEYKNNETFQGDSANASKNFIDKIEIVFANTQVSMQNKLRNLYLHAISEFSEKVDSAPDARIDLATLDMVENDLRSIYANLEEYGSYFEKTADSLREKYGHICDFTKPDSSAAKNLNKTSKQKIQEYEPLPICFNHLQRLSLM